MIDQRIFRESCKEKIPRQARSFLGFSVLFQMIKRASPMRIYKIVHVGPKTHEGGLKDGLLSATYQLVIWGIVEIEPIAPARRGAAMETMNLYVFVLVMMFSW